MDRYRDIETGTPQRAKKLKPTEQRAAAERSEARFRNRPIGIQGGTPGPGGSLLMHATLAGSPLLLTARYREAGRGFSYRRAEVQSMVRWILVDPWGHRLWETCDSEEQAQARVADLNEVHAIGKDLPW